MLDSQTCGALVLKGWIGTAAQTWRGIGSVIQCTSVLVGRCGLEQVLTIVYMRQVRGACLSVINGTEVGSSGGIVIVQMMQASTSDVVGVVFTVIRVSHL